jgi:hypothetical protein
VAPPTASQLVQGDTDLLWMKMAVAELLVTAVFSVTLSQSAVAYLLVFGATRSFTIAWLCALSIVAVLSCWMGLAVCLGMLPEGLGMVESLVFMVAVRPSAPRWT